MATSFLVMSLLIVLALVVGWLFTLVFVSVLFVFSLLVQTCVLARDAVSSWCHRFHDHTPTSEQDLERDAEAGLPEPGGRRGASLTRADHASRRRYRAF